MTQTVFSNHQLSSVVPSDVTFLHVVLYEYFCTEGAEFIVLKTRSTLHTHTAEQGRALRESRHDTQPTQTPYRASQSSSCCPPALLLIRGTVGAAICLHQEREAGTVSACGSRLGLQCCFPARIRDVKRCHVSWTHSNMFRATAFQEGTAARHQGMILKPSKRLFPVLRLPPGRTCCPQQ